MNNPRISKVNEILSLDDIDTDIMFIDYENNKSTISIYNFDDKRINDAYVPTKINITKSKLIGLLNELLNLGITSKTKSKCLYISDDKKIESLRLILPSCLFQLIIENEELQNEDCAEYISNKIREGLKVVNYESKI